MTRHSDERGNVTVLVAAFVVVAMLLGVALADFGHIVIAKSRANSAADATALAAADELALGRSASSACASAGETAAANGARLLACFCDTVAPVKAAEVTLEVAHARARARAEVDAGLTAVP